MAVFFYTFRPRLWSSKPQYIMPTVNDVLQHIAQDFNSFNWGTVGLQVSGPDVATKFLVSIAITSDVEETEASFLERYGFGRTFYFRLRSYEQGKQLAADLYKVFLNGQPDMEKYTGSLFGPEDQLYLFIHLRFRRLPAVE